MKGAREKKLEKDAGDGSLRRKLEKEARNEKLEKKKLEKEAGEGS